MHVLKGETLNADFNLSLRQNWELATMSIDYEPLDRRGFSSEIDISRVSNITTSIFRGSVKWRFVPQLTLRSLLTINYVISGNQTFKKYNERVPTILTSHMLNYRYNQNATLELTFKYISSRFIEEFEGIEENSNLVLPPTVRPIYLLSFSSNMYFFDQRMMLSLSLSNLFNQAISYNTNGQYYDMAVAVKSTIRI